MDARRRQYVPLSVRFALGNTGTTIHKRFGVEGLGIWACLLAAAKRSDRQGTFEWTDEGDAWSRLGVSAGPPAFTFQAFVTLLGRMKLARTVKVGRLRVTELQGWSEWNVSMKQAESDARKRRKPQGNTADNRAGKGRTEVEGEGETPPPPGSPRQNGKSPRQRGVNPRAQQPANELVRCTAGCERWTGTPEDLVAHLETVHLLDLPPATVPDDDDLFA